MRTNTPVNARAAGFALEELLIATTIVAVIMGSALTGMTDAYRAAESAKGIIGLNNNLRIGADLIVRDLIQVGQGMPMARTVQVPAGTGAMRIHRPHPHGSHCTHWAEGTTTIPAVSAGPGCGPTINGRATDMVTTLSVDSILDAVPVWSINAGTHTATISLPSQATGGVNISTGGPDDVRVGDLMMFTKGSGSALVYVTAAGGGQTITFGPGDPMHLNQFDDALNGTIDDLAAAAPTTANSAAVSRIRMISYYLDTTTDPGTPRLIRHMNWGDPADIEDGSGRTVAFNIENLQFTYDMVDGATNPSNVRMTDTDLTTAGACAPRPCSSNQIRKINVFVAGRSAQRFSTTGHFFRNSLNTQVSLRSLALVDRYK